MVRGCIDINDAKCNWLDSSRWKPSKVTKDTNVSRQGYGLCLLGCTRFIDHLEKGRTINSEYYIALLVHLKKEITKKWPQMKKNKYSFTKTMHRVTSRSQRWQNYMNCTLNCFHTHPILQIWPPVTTGCLQISKECSRERDLAPMKKWNWKLRHILRPKTNRSIKKTLNC